ncbi:LuxR C-terminal-related transcriptional regulator [Streptomyces xanthochromogenes]|uniref:LuxR C-terminal-related transcriptional regulator n=1 Tax=Streptomyces xanthochromogenes TaxID=67384 RepID=UPI0034204AEA
MATPDPFHISKAQQRVASHVVHGHSNVGISAKLHLSESTVRTHITKGSKIVGCPTGSSRAMYAHALLTRKQVTPPSAPRTGIRSTAREERLLHALVTHSRIDDIARAAGIHRDDVRLETDALRCKTRALNNAHLVGIAHSLKIFERAVHEAPAGAAR